MTVCKYTRFLFAIRVVGHCLLHLYWLMMVISTALRILFDSKMPRVIGDHENVGKQGRRVLAALFTKFLFGVFKARQGRRNTQQKGWWREKLRGQCLDKNYYSGAREICKLGATSFPDFFGLLVLPAFRSPRFDFLLCQSLFVQTRRGDSVSRIHKAENGMQMNSKQTEALFQVPFFQLTLALVHTYSSDKASIWKDIASLW